MSDWNDLVHAPWHLVRRFFTSLSGSSPSVTDEVWVDRQLTPAERRLWIQLGNRDRRHSIDVARRFVERRPDAGRAEIAGALLHDIGKIESRLGTLGRVVATVVGPRTPRMRDYHDHEEIGARLVEAVGSDPVTVDLVAGRGDIYPDLKTADY